MPQRQHEPESGSRARPHVLRLLLRGLIRLYQLTLSSIMGRTCRYAPSCSEYADEAIARHGVWIGGWMAMCRISRCHPWGSSGYDPVPKTLNAKSPWWAPWRAWR